MLLSLLTALLICIPGFASDDTQLRSFLQRFKNHPAEAMAEAPSKIRDAEFKPLFGKKTIQDRSFITAKDSFRKMILTKGQSNQRILSEYGGEDNPYAFFDNPSNVVDRLDQMSQRNLQSAKLATAPWSDTYWPLYQGQTGARYADAQFPASRDWKINFDFIVANPPSLQDPTKFLTYSPSEKYDILVGNASFELTQSAWSEGKAYYDRYGNVETWMGICHGWAAAAFMLPKPAKSIELNYQGGTIKFFPADIRAMGTLLWATGRSNTRFLGGRCDSKDPEIEPDTGRVIAENCFDTNPATWHIAVVNRIGVENASFVMDANFDYEVWNQPVYSYKYRFFNPQSGQPVDTLDAGRVSMSEFTADKFKKHRTTRAASVVGISMDVTYVVENRPFHNDDETLVQPYLTTVRYVYDLELDEGGTIIGGEWYQRAHPDFLWRPTTNAKASSIGDRMITGNWTGNGPVPESWRYGARVSASYGQPLARVVDVLYEKSK